MALLTEYAVTPDVFDVTAYTSDEVCGLHIDRLREVLLHEALVRDLRGGDWGRLFVGTARSWHLRAKELMKALKSNKRLVAFPAANATVPATDADWCNEALATHGNLRLDGIIVTDGVAVPHKTNPLVASIAALPGAPWWTGRSSSVRPERTLAGFRAALGLVLRHANSMMFIDPHMDFSTQRYKSLVSLLQDSGKRTPAPVIELHRVCYRGSGPGGRQILTNQQAEDLFRPVLTAPLAAVGISAEVFVWDDFHDRYVISDLVGISVPHGFDTTSAETVTTWTRMGRTDSDDVQREFDPASGRHKIRHRFRVP